jgi:hypothetical protein
MPVHRITSPNISPFGARPTSTIAAGSRGMSAPVTLCECARPVNVLGPASGPDKFTDEEEYELPLNMSGIERVFLSLLRGVAEAIESCDPMALVRGGWVITLLNDGGINAWTLIRERRSALGACR